METQIQNDKNKVEELLGALSSLRKKQRDDLDASSFTPPIPKETLPVSSSSVTPVVMDSQFSLEDMIASTPLPNINHSGDDDSDRPVYGPINKVPEDKAEVDDSSRGSIRDLYVFFKLYFRKHAF